MKHGKSETQFIKAGKFNFERKRKYCAAHGWIDLILVGGEAGWSSRHAACDLVENELFNELMEVLLPFDVAFPEFQEHYDRLFYYLMIKITGETPDETFAEFFEVSLDSRFKRPAYMPPNSAYLLAQSLPLKKVLSRIALEFPDIAIHADRACFETMRKLSPNSLSFEMFHQTAQEIRRVASRVLSVGGPR